jgi:hypothetical protein
LGEIEEVAFLLSSVLPLATPPIAWELIYQPNTPQTHELLFHSQNKNGALSHIRYQTISPPPHHLILLSAPLADGDVDV